jgi:hypothetical protein
MADRMSVRTFIGVSNDQHERLGISKMKQFHFKNETARFKNEMVVPGKRNHVSRGRLSSSFIVAGAGATRDGPWYKFGGQRVRVVQGALHRRSVSPNPEEGVGSLPRSGIRNLSSALPGGVEAELRRA